jgi:hypothetical protein
MVRRNQGRIGSALCLPDYGTQDENRHPLHPQYGRPDFMNDIAKEKQSELATDEGFADEKLRSVVPATKTAPIEVSSGEAARDS